MAKCSICGAETFLYNNGVPICIKCDEKSKQPATPAVPVTPKRAKQERAVEFSRAANR